MEYRKLGRTGLDVSILGQGCGGPSVLGHKYGWDEERRGAVVRRALDLGITLFDTSIAYGDSEEILGRWLPPQRDRQVIISTKTFDSLTPAELDKRFKESLTALQRDSVDIMLFHDLKMEVYARVVSEHIPQMRKWKEQGKIRAIGFSQACPDQEHTMGWRGLQDSHIWDVMLLTYSLFSQQLRFELLPRLQEKEIGVMTMNAVRKDLRNYETMEQELTLRRQEGNSNVPDISDVRTLLEKSGCADIPEAVYRFVAHTPGVHVTLSGSTDPAHMKANAEAVSRGPLPPRTESQLIEWFRTFRLKW